jgi:hypothetical protein
MQNAPEHKILSDRLIKDTEQISEKTVRAEMTREILEKLEASSLEKLRGRWIIFLFF